MAGMENFPSRPLSPEFGKQSANLFLKWLFWVIFIICGLVVARAFFFLRENSSPSCWLNAKKNLREQKEEITTSQTKARNRLPRDPLSHFNARCASFSRNPLSSPWLLTKRSYSSRPTVFTPNYKQSMAGSMDSAFYKSDSCILVLAWVS
jgi:hypothetical protein